MTEIIMRELLEDDIEPCVEMTVTSFPWTDFGLSLDSARKFFSDRFGKNLVFVATINAHVVGFITIKRNILFANYIRRIVVRADKRSLGIGAHMLSFIEALTLEENLPNVFMITTTTNTRAIAFYEKNGYKNIGRIPSLIHEGMDEFILWKSRGTVNDFKVYD